MGRGRVVDFDEHVGLGHVVDDGGTTLLFHCVEIADGTRSIDIETRVSFSRLAKLGTYEAGCLAKL